MYEKLEKIKDKEEHLGHEFKKKTVVKDAEIKNMYEAILSRERILYSISNIFSYMLNCLCCRRPVSYKGNERLKPHYLFKKAAEKYKKELDIVNIVKTIRRFKLFAQAMLAQRHRMLLRFQKKNLVTTSSSSSDSDKDQFDPVKQMSSENPVKRLVGYGHMKKMM